MSVNNITTWECKHCCNVNNMRDERCLKCCRKAHDYRLPGFIVTGLDAPGIVDHLSRCGELRAVLDAACALYGLQLRMAEDVAHTLDAVPTVEAQLGQRIAHTIARANIGQGDAWWMYNCTFRFLNDKADVAIDGLVRCNQ